MLLRYLHFIQVTKPFIIILYPYFVTSLSGYDCDFTSLAVYGAAVLEHCLMEEGFPENAKIGKGFNLEEG